MEDLSPGANEGGGGGSSLILVDIPAGRERGGRVAFPKFCEQRTMFFFTRNETYITWNEVDTQMDIKTKKRERCTFQISTMHSKYWYNLRVGVLEILSVRAVFFPPTC